MKRLLLLFAGVVMSLCASAQQPETASITLEEGDSAAMAVLERYHLAMPELESSRMIRSWRPHLYSPLPHLIGDKPHLWEQTATAPTINIEKPVFVDYNSVTLRLGDGGNASITISNGSAYNFMPWHNYPGAYRDARTLSFPMRR